MITRTPIRQNVNVLTYLKVWMRWRFGYGSIIFYGWGGCRFRLKNSISMKDYLYESKQYLLIRKYGEERFLKMTILEILNERI